MNEHQISPYESAAKHALDRGEFIECIPVLQRSAIDINVNDRGGPVLVLPTHRLVNDFIRELNAAHTTHYNELRDDCRALTADLKSARKHFNAAHRRYDKRVSHRLLSSSMTNEDARYVELGRYSSLSAILIDRAEAAFWRKIVKELEYFQRVKLSNERSITAGRVRRDGRALAQAIKQSINRGAS